MYLSFLKGVGEQIKALKGNSQSQTPNLYSISDMKN